MNRRFLTAKLSLFWLLGAVACVLVPVAIQAALPNGTPARAVPRTLWGNLEPMDDPDSLLPSNRDTTDYNEFGRQRFWTVPWWMSMDIENGLIFTIGSQSLQIWDPSNDPGNPTLLVSTVREDIIDYVTGEAATGWPMRDVDAPPNVDTVVGVAGAELGFLVWDTSNKSNPRNVYQYSGEALEIYATTLQGRHYAFVATNTGLLGFDMTRSLDYGSCHDNTAGTVCPGVFKGDIGSLRSASYVDGTGTFVAATGGRGVKIWDVNGFPSQSLKLDALGNDPIRGVALWRDVNSSNHYLAVVTSFFQAGVGNTFEGRIYNVSCITSANGCAGIGSVVARVNLGTNHGARSFVTYSRSGPSAFLYFGTDNRLGGGPQREFLVDVTDPEDSNLTQDITPPGTNVVDGKTLDYWSWYYEGNIGPNNLAGFNNVGPRRGKFLGEFFYRAAWSIFDVHRRAGGLPPAVDFDWVSQEPDGKIYSGSRVDFIDNSTGQPNGWSWFFQGGSPQTSTNQDPKGITFNSSGPFPDEVGVTLTAFNNVGSSDPLTKSLEILDPAPGLTGVSANVQSATVCQPITFEAQGVTGRSPLTFSWEVVNSQGGVVVPATTPASNPSRFVWDTQPGLLSGNYQANLTVTGAAGTDPATGQSNPVAISSLAQLPSAGSFTPTNDPFIAGSVDFHVVASGATEWNWHWGDGTTSGWLTDPVEGPNPSHDYQEVGTYQVTVQVRNCTNPDSPVTSAVLEVDIVSIEELKAEFAATGVTCARIFGDLVCSVEVGDTVSFQDRSTGAESYSYDWNGDGIFEEGPRDTPQTSHTFNQAGSFRPRLKVTRGESEEDVFEHGELSVVQPGGNPPPPPATPRINVGANKSFASPDELVTFTASASNCTPAASGWTWSTTGGTISGGSNGSRITVSWSSNGRKNVVARNSACGTAAGSAAVTISDSSEPPPTGGGDELEAIYTITPSEPEAGQTVTFNGSASTGNPATYLWNFGDGSDLTGTVVPQVQHVYTEPGTYQVSLTVSRPGDCTNFGICTSLDAKKTLVVTGTTGPPPPPEPESLTICPDDPNGLCFFDDRFKVTVEWMDPRSQNTGVGKPIAEDPLPGQDTTGFFWFFNPNSVDLIVKLLNGVDFNGSIWFFYGGLSDVEYIITVEDREAVPPIVRTYTNDAGNICGQADTRAFPQTVNLPGGQTVTLTGQSFDDAVGADAVTGIAAPTHSFGGDGEEDGGGDDGGSDGGNDGGNDGGGDDGGGDGGSVTGDTESCQPGPETLCLLDGRFEVEVAWRDPRPPFNTGTGRAIQGTQETGYFWFFNPSNVELVIKMIDARESFDHFWFFFGALTDVEYDISVRDVVTGNTKSYTNVAGNICGQADTRAFDDEPELP